jgi:hypothetical protein
MHTQIYEEGGKSAEVSCGKNYEKGDENKEEIK